MASFRDIKALANFDEHVKPFFESWGLIPEHETHETVPPEVLEQGINECCYSKLLKEAESFATSSKYGSYFRAFCARQINATDGGFYLSAETWVELWEAWEKYLAEL